ncbi:hypothetical protein FRB93_007847 [Tulasnella sp. JGI-2019a]|nr:hypothetical protein FRB93_007847 [Tulasnella sp. JGI-2019a]
MAPSLLHGERPTFVGPTTAPTTVHANSSLLGVLIALVAVLLVLGVWLLHRWRKFPFLSRKAPATPELAIQDYKAPRTSHETFLSYHMSYPSLSQPSPVYASDKFQGENDTFMISRNQSKTVRYTMTPSIALPATATTRLSLNLPDSLSLSSEIESLVDVPSMSTSLSAHNNTTEESIETERSTSPAPTRMRISQAELVRALKAGDQCHNLPTPFAPKTDHITSFKLPPIIGSPALSSSQDLKAWCRPLSIGKLMEELRFDLLPGQGYESTAIREYPTSYAMLPISISQDDVDTAFKRFSLLAFQNSVATIHSPQESPKATDLQFKAEPFPVHSVRARSATVTTPKSPTYRPTHTGQYQPWGSKSVSGTIGPSFSLPPWEKVALLSQYFPAMLSDDRGTETGEVMVESPKPSVDQTPKLPLVESATGVLNTPEFFFRGIRSQIFETPPIPSFETPMTDAGGDDRLATPREINGPAAGQLMTTPPLNASLLSARSTLQQSTPHQFGAPLTRFTSRSLATFNDSDDLIPCTPPFGVGSGGPSRFNLAGSSSQSLDEFTRELLQLVQSSRFPPHSMESGGMDTARPTSSTSNGSLSLALAGIGLNFVQTPSASEASLARWRVSVSGLGSVAAKRYIATRLSQHLEREDLVWDEDEEDGQEVISLLHAEQLIGQPSGISVDGVAGCDALASHNGATSFEVEQQQDPPEPSAVANIDLGTATLQDKVEVGEDVDNGVRIAMESAATIALVDPLPRSNSNAFASDPNACQLGGSSAESDPYISNHIDLCPPLVVVTSPTLAMCFRRFGINIDPIMDGGGDLVYDSGSDYGSDDDGDSSSASEFAFDRTYNLVRKRSGEESADDAFVPPASSDLATSISATTSSAYSSDSISHSSASLSTSSIASVSSTSSSRIPILSRSTARLLASPVIDFTDGGKHNVQVVHRPHRYPDPEQRRKFADFVHFTATVIRRHRADTNATAVTQTQIPVLQRRKCEGMTDDSKDGSMTSRSQGPTPTLADGSNPPSLYGEDSDRWLEKSDFGGCLMDETFPGGEDSDRSLQAVA